MAEFDCLLLCKQQSHEINFGLSWLNFTSVIMGLRVFSYSILMIWMSFIMWQKLNKGMWGKTVLKIKGCLLSLGSSVPQGRTWELIKYKNELYFNELWHYTPHTNTRIVETTSWVYCNLKFVLFLEYIINGSSIKINFGFHREDTTTGSTQGEVPIPINHQCHKPP